MKTVKTVISKRWILVLCIISSVCMVGCGGGSSSTGAKLLESEFQDENNWTVYKTYDRLEEGSSTVNAQFRAASASFNQHKITTYTANGLISELFNYLAANSSGLAIGSRDYGVSVLNFNDMSSPKGNAYNYRKEWLEGIAAYQDRFFAWFFDGSIVDIASGEVIYENAPIGTSSIYASIPKNRFVIDNGHYYIGTSNLESDGSLSSYGDNGFWKIDGMLTTKTRLINHPVWCVYKDSENTMWAGTQDGIYKEDGGVYVKVFGGYAEQIFEYDGGTYALIKDFFHKPDDDNDFDLFQWDGATFQRVCEVSDAFGNIYIDEMHAFEWEGTLYITRWGSSTDLLVYDGEAFSLQNKPIYDGRIGQQHTVVADGKLFTVGNLTGLNIWDGIGLIQLNTVNTAEGLISNDIKMLYVASDGRLWIGPHVSGFNVLDDEGSFEIEELADEITIAGFFEKDGSAFVQGASYLYEVTDTSIDLYKRFPCNGERVYYDDGHAKLWAFPNHGEGNGALGMLDMDTMTIYATTGKDGRADYWERDYEWDKPAYHFNDVIAIPGEGAVFIAVENGSGIVLRYDYQADTFDEVSIPIEQIRYFHAQGAALFGVGPGALVKYENGTWAVVNDGLSSQDPVDIEVKNKFAFIPTNDSLEVLQLASGKTSVWGLDELPINGRIQSIAMRTQKTTSITTKAYSLYFGTTQGLVICDLNLN